MTIRARYPGRCYQCGQPIRPGDMIDWDKATRRTRHTECPEKVETPKQDAKPAETQDAGLRRMVARYAGQCSACGEEIRAGAEIVYDRQHRRAYHARCEAVATAPAPYKIGGGSGYGYTGWRPGQVLATSERQQKEYGFPEFLTVVRAGAEYIREDGMSFGVGDEQGYVYWAECREATEEEAAPLKAEAEAAVARKAAKVRVAEIAKMIQDTGERPQADPIGPNDEGYREDYCPGFILEGEKLLDTGNLYGSGDWFVVEADYIWFVRNNGGDGDDWNRNNVRTGGAGAIGWRIPASEELVAELRRLNETLK